MGGGSGWKALGEGLAESSSVYIVRRRHCCRSLNDREADRREISLDLPRCLHRRDQLHGPPVDQQDTLRPCIHCFCSQLARPSAFKCPLAIGCPADSFAARPTHIAKLLPMKRLFCTAKIRISICLSEYDDEETNGPGSTSTTCSACLRLPDHRLARPVGRSSLAVRG